MHLMNIFIAMTLSVKNDTDECVWYFINNVVDTLLGLMICYILMLLLEYVTRYKNWKVTA